MTSSHGRRVPPKARGPRPDPAGQSGAEPGATGEAGPAPGPDSSAAGAGRPPTRAQNRAAKRSTGVRAKNVRRGPVQARRQTNLAAIGLVAGLVVIAAAVFAFGNPFGAPAPTASLPASAGAVVTYGDGTCPTSQPAALPAGQSKLVTIGTDLGEIVVRVDGALSPIAAGNFVALAECQYYDGVVFHRTPTLSDGTPFVIQGGDPAGTGSGDGPGYTIQDEPVTATYKRGTVAMARTSQPNSQGSQFFIVLDDKSAEPLASANTYAIFGEVVSGMEVADAIFQASGGQELPTSPIAMTTVTVADAPPPTASPAAGSPGASPAPSEAASPAAASPASTP
jgi:peptidyl-prolyl cis-trans isomerase B (cyclophilin B)